LNKFDNNATIKSTSTLSKPESQLSIKRISTAAHHRNPSAFSDRTTYPISPAKSIFFGV